MKVTYPIKGVAEIKVLKEELKPFGGRCAKIVENTLEFQIKEENQPAAYEYLKEKGYIS
ncbi:hypothetical protein [Pseudoneobacillus rhizosphaerae]|uniref:Uncharacterized protein n=1 Tax=Pseudoneobacillus rhizosphaerae TaxID=2880968 RepID=A0A9C7G8H8_9BACI|nr:hypothetical protein [Pseudoneobacillus rhizosphaerae]CAG9607600.1 hypothetical protein NEOCIP111885_01292 [Pseudoneobacillus rhizosphaerae]